MSTTSMFRIISLIGSLLLIASAGIASAETLREEVVQNRLDIREEAFQERQEIRTEAFETRASTTEARKAVITERKAALTERQQTRIENLAANISNRIEKAMARLSNIADRLESRIEKLKASGVDTSEAEPPLASARAHLVELTNIMSAIDTTVVAATTSTTPKESWVQVRATFTNAKALLQSVRTDLEACIAALKASVTAARTTTPAPDATDDNTH